MEGHVHADAGAANDFPTDVGDAPDARQPRVLDLADGDRVELRIAAVAKRIGGATVRMLAYNGSVPGPTLRVREGSQLVVEVVNEGDLETTVHWHGLRLDNRYDGTHETQAPIPVGGRFTYRLEFPDPGVYWYHPHIREDYGQELGLYGNVLVVPRDEDYWPPAHREELLTLDDVLLEDGKIAPFSRSHTSHAAMGRFGNVLLVGGETDPVLRARRGEVVRFFLTNTANTRVFEVAAAGARMKLVGGDSGRYEHERLVESVVLAPSERAVVDVCFDDPGEAALEHRTPRRTYVLAKVHVTDDDAPPLPRAFAAVRSNPEWAAVREWVASFLDAPPDKTLALVAELDLGAPDGAAVYTCPMHPEITSGEPGRCPKCGMKLLPASVAGDAGGHGRGRAHGDEHRHGHGDEGSAHARGHEGQGHADAYEGHEHAHGHEGHGHAHGHEGHGHAHGDADAAAGGIEWEDDMVEVNRITTPANTRWSIVDRATGAHGHAIDWTLRVGDRVKIRLVNELDSDHPMHHPFHVHGAGRLLVLARDGVPEDDLVWKDTVLVRTGETVDLLLEVTNPGRWMAHCHIAEHHESGMMFAFTVAPRNGG